MKTSKSSVKSAAKKAITLGLAAMMIVSCGKKSKNKVSNGPTTNAYTNGLAPGQVCPQGTSVQRIFNYSQGGGLTLAAYKGSVVRSYLGSDPTTGDSATVNVDTSGNLQLLLTIKCTGDTNIDNTLLNNSPTITQQFGFDANVSNPGQCSGRINYGTIVFGYAQTQYGVVPIQSSFQPPQNCY